MLLVAALLFLEAVAVRHRALRLLPRGGGSAPTAAGNGGGTKGRRWLWTVEQCALRKMRVWAGLVGGPLLALGEWFTHKAWHGGNVQVRALVCVGMND